MVREILFSSNELGDPMQSFQVALGRISVDEKDYSLDTQRNDGYCSKPEFKAIDHPSGQNSS